MYYGTHLGAVDPLVNDDLGGFLAPAELEELGKVEDHRQQQHTGLKYYEGQTTNRKCKP